MEENLKMLSLKTSLMKKESFIIFHVQELHNKIELLKEKIEHFKKWQEQC